MSEKSVQFVIAVFDTEEGAEETLSNLKAEEKEELQGVQAAVAMRKDADNRIHYKDVGMTPAKGAIAGVVMGALVGIVTGGTGLVLGAVGALLGGVIGKRKREDHIAAEQVNQVVASIPPGSSALLTIVEDEAAADFEELLHAASAHTFSAEISSDLAAELSDHADAAHAALMEELTE
jgi:uncharacterized membrane protein